ncbi:MAG: starch-binding protein [Lachnospiraceae bacterium]|nr:starch-binding protein [Lachnospiraceae bacterium]
MRRWQIGACAVAGMFAVAGLSFAGLQMSEKTNTTQVEFASKPVTALQLSTAEKKQNKGITIHYKWGDTQPHLSYSSKTAGTTSYPGVPMNDEGNGWYSYTIEDASEADIIMSVPELEFQTSQFSRTEGEYWYDYSNGWSMKAPESYTEVTEVEVEEVQVAASEQITVHYPVSEISDAKIYYWNLMPTDKSVKWPGEVMKESDGYYSYTFSGTSKANFLFTNDKNQSDDFTIKKAGEYWYSAGKWVTEKPSGSGKTENTSEPTKTDEPSATPGAMIEPGTGKTASFADTRTDFRDETIYFLMTTRFYDGDSSNNDSEPHDKEVGNPASDPDWRGDFKGLIQKLDYIKSLGFTAVWITPVVKNHSRSNYSYHGYHACNFKQVDPRYESSDASYQDLINAAHKKGIKIIQDIVLNHVGGYGEENLQTLETNAEGKIASQDPNGYYNHDYIKSWESYQVQTTSIDGDCIDLNTENRHVIDYLNEAYDRYINMGVDAFRIDTVKHISRLTFNKEFLPHFLKTAKAKGTDNFYMFGEACARDENALYFGNMASISAFFYTWAESTDWAWGDNSVNAASVEAHFTKYSSVSREAANAEFNSDNAYLKGNEYHKPDTSKSSGMGVIDFPMHWSFRNAENAYNRAIQDDALYNDATWNVVYVDSHDYGPNTMEKIRYAEGTEAWAENLSLMFTFRGIPCIYYGSEVEFQAGKKIDDYRAKLADTGRAYFGDEIEGDVTATDFAEYTASGAVQEALNYKLSKHIQRLNKIRQAIPALRKGQYSTEGVSGNMAYKRRYTDENIDSFACIAVTNEATFSNIPNGTYTDAVSGDVQKVTNGTLKISAPGKGNCRVYVLDTAKTKAPGKVGQDGTFLK